MLTALAGEPRHGYAVIEDVRSISGGRVRLHTGTLYAVLDRLREAGLVEVDREEVVASRLRRYYRLTGAGVERLTVETEQLQRNCRRGRQQAARVAAGRGRRHPMSGRRRLRGAAEVVLERRYRRLLAWYPAGYRAANQDEMLAVALAGAELGQRWPGVGEAASLVRRRVAAARAARSAADRCLAEAASGGRAARGRPDRRHLRGGSSPGGWRPAGPASRSGCPSPRSCWPSDGPWLRGRPSWAGAGPPRSVLRSVRRGRPGTWPALPFRSGLRRGLVAAWAGGIHRAGHGQPAGPAANGVAGGALAGARRDAGDGCGARRLPAGGGVVHHRRAVS